VSAVFFFGGVIGEERFKPFSSIRVVVGGKLKKR